MIEDPISPRDTALLASRLRQHKQRVLQLWEKRARRRVPAARRQEGPALFNHLPDILDQLVDTLASPWPRHTLERQENALAVDPGDPRARLTEYSLDQVISEYQLLQQVLFEVLEEERPLSRMARDLVLDAIHMGVRNGVDEFIRCRHAEKELAQEALSQANANLERRVQERTAELTRTEERFRTMVEVVKDYAIFTVDPEGYISTWNAGAQRMKGYAGTEAIGQHYSMLYPEEGRRRNEPMGHLKTAAIEGRFRGEGLRIRKNGDLFIADVSLTPIYEEGALTGFAKVVQDLTERNLLMQERDLTRTHAERLEAESEYRKRFVATMTHDLRSPLSAAKAAAQMIARSPEHHDKVRIWALRITDAVDRTDRMVSDLLDASRLEAGERPPLKFEPCDLKKIAEELCADLSTRHGDRFKIEAEGTTTGVWSEEGLRRVLDNLLSNAIKYGDVMAPITTRILRVGEHVLLAVHNRGTIIPVEEQQQLFQPYHRTQIAQASDKRGWGLGLTLVKGIVEAHRGMVKVESYPKEGTTFTVDLPVDAARPSRSSPAQDA